MTISTNDLSNNDNFNNRIDTIRNITQTLAQELENQLRMPIGDDISYANLELSVSFIDISIMTFNILILNFLFNRNNNGTIGYSFICLKISNVHFTSN